MRKSDSGETAAETVVRRPSLKQLAQQVIERQPIVSNADRKRAIIAARDASCLADFRGALISGRLYLCGNCARFTFSPDPTQGECSRHGEVQSFIPFACSDFDLSKEPTAPAYVPRGHG